MKAEFKSKLVVLFDRAIEDAANSGCEILYFKLDSEEENKMLRDYIDLQGMYVNGIDYDYEGVLIKEYAADASKFYKRLPTKVIDGTLYYLIEHCRSAMSDKEYYLNGFDQLVRDFCTTLSEEEITEFSQIVIGRVYAKQGD